MTSDFKKLFTGPGKNDILLNGTCPYFDCRRMFHCASWRLMFPSHHRIDVRKHCATFGLSPATVQGGGGAATPCTARALVLCGGGAGCTCGFAETPQEVRLTGRRV